MPIVDDLPDNTLMLQMTILDNGDLNVVAAHKFASDLSTEEAQYYHDLLMGLNHFLQTATDMVREVGYMGRIIEEIEDVQIDFEPAEELLEAIADAKVISFKGKMH